MSVSLTDIFLPGLLIRASIIMIHEQNVNRRVRGMQGFPTYIENNKWFKATAYKG